MSSAAKSNSGLFSLRSLPPFPPLASKLMELLGRPDANFRDAVELMKSDASITVEVLRLANSASAMSKYPITNLLQALSFLGVNRIVSLATTLCIGKLLKPLSSNPVMRRCWRNNLATALIASRLSDASDLDSETAYTFGLLSGIGRLALLVSDPALYAHLVSRAETEGTPLEILEMDMFGFDNIEAGRWLAKEWKLPAELGAVLFVGPLPNGPNARLAQLIREAAAEAARLGFGVLDTPRYNPSNPLSFEIAERVNQVEQDLGL